MDFLPENTLIIMDDWDMIRMNAEEIEEQAENLRKQSIREERFRKIFRFHISASQKFRIIWSLSSVSISASGDRKHAGYSDACISI
jgi:hypothetical protein